VGALAYLEGFLDYPFHPKTVHAEHVLDALRACGHSSFNALFDRRDAGGWLAASSVLQFAATIRIFCPGPGKLCTIRKPVRSLPMGAASNAGSTNCLTRRPPAICLTSA